MTYVMAQIVTYDDPALRFNPRLPRRLVYPRNVDTKFVAQRHPVPPSMRALAAPLTLPRYVTATYYRDGTPGRDRPTSFAVRLDPGANHGYTAATFSPYHDEGRRFSLTVEARPGDWPGGNMLTDCPRCGDPWCVATQESYGNATNCPACKYHSFYDIGD